jgi:hypothetical protein
LPAAASAVDLNPPRGQFVELHSCEVLAGPCVVNSEVNQAGNYQLRVWQFNAGALANASLEGLTVALLEKSSEDQNLADRGAASDAVAYLPPGLTAAQRSALLAWAQLNTAAKLDAAHVKIAPVGMAIVGQQVTFSAGTALTFGGDTPTPCPPGTCGELLWYQPRTPASSFVVDQVGQSNITEPLLGLHWMDHGRKTIFLGRFGYPEATIPGLCGAPELSRE